MKVFVLAPSENWICDRIAAEWHLYNSELTTYNIAEADVLWLLAGWCWNHVPFNILSQKKVIVTVHHIVPEKFTLQKVADFHQRDQFVDAYHVPNDKTRIVVEQLTTKPIHVIPYWYDGSLWTQIDKLAARWSLNLPQDKFIIGSFQRDSEGATGLPKLEKGPDLFCDAVEKLNTGGDVHVLLGGWRREYVKKRLDDAKIEYTFCEKVNLETLMVMYAALDLYIIASRHEGGPQAVLEAAAMKTPVISRDVGIASLVLPPECIMDIPDEISIPSEASIEKSFQRVLKFEINSHKKCYNDMFKEVSCV